MSYPLYHTLNKNLKKSDLTDTQKDELMTKISNLTDESEKNAVIMLIIEHSKDADGIVQDSSKIVLPYGIKQEGKNVQIDFNKLPIPLRWIIWKFINIKKT